VNEHDAIERIKRLSHSINCADEIAEVIERLIKERDEARREVCEWEHHWDKTSSEQYYADKRGWNCYKDAKVVKTLKGVVVSKGKAVPPKFELGEDDQ
jgi:hypothetical protein